MRAGYSFETALEMSPSQLFAICDLDAERQRARVAMNAVSSRASQADKKGWQGFLKELEQ